MSAHDRYLLPGAPAAGRVWLRGDEFHHMARVRRRRAGDVVVLLDGQGGERRARIVRVAADAAELEIEAAYAPRPAPGPKLIIAFSPPKGARADALAEKCAELGVDELWPVRCARTVVRLDASSPKLDRWRRLAAAAAKQCGRPAPPAVLSPGRFEDALARAADAKWIAAPTPDARPLSQTCADAAPPSGSAALCLIGPEGGFTDAELRAARGAGFEPVSLGANVLRVETAAIAACAIVRAFAPPAPRGADAPRRV